MDVLARVSDIGSILTIALGLYVFFKDPIRRWSFFGYKPTALILIIDPKKHLALLVHSREKNVWHFPQGGIYSNEINEVVNEILVREVAISKDKYKFVKTIQLGTIKRDNWSYSEKYSPGSVSISRVTRGKLYLGCVVLTDLTKKRNRFKAGHDIDKYQIVDIKKSLKIIDPKKAALIEKVLPQISGIV